jgi:hypothetical protein
VIRLIVAFPSEVSELFGHFEQLEAKRQQPWHHNRHMTIVRREGVPQGAVYFARHHRTPYVTPVMVHDREDVGVLQTTFRDRWHSKSAKEIIRD